MVGGNDSTVLSLLLGRGGRNGRRLAQSSGWQQQQLRASRQRLPSLTLAIVTICSPCLRVDKRPGFFFALRDFGAVETRAAQTGYVPPASSIRPPFLSLAGGCRASTAATVRTHWDPPSCVRPPPSTELAALVRCLDELRVSCRFSFGLLRYSRERCLSAKAFHLRANELAVA